MKFLPLRGYGPKVFISYSFTDKDLAKVIHEKLCICGFQLRMEDERSLIDKNLEDVIFQRIRESEVLIQLRTESSNKSDWVEKELGMAIDLKERGANILILPIVFDDTDLSQKVSERWYLNLANGTLTDEVLQFIEKTCLGAIHLLPISDDYPFEFACNHLEKMLFELPSDKKRVLVDCNNLIGKCYQESLDYFETMDSEHKDSLIAQEKKSWLKSVDFFKVMDEVTRKLALETYSFLNDRGFKRPEKDSIETMSNFSRIVIGIQVIERLIMLPPNHSLRKTFADEIKTAKGENGNTVWNGLLNPHFYSWAFMEEGGKDRMSKMGIGASGYKGVYLQVPKAIFGSMEKVYTTMPISFDPKGELYSGTFAKYILPQIGVASLYNTLFDGIKNTRKAFDQYAWHLKEYDRMGLA